MRFRTFLFIALWFAACQSTSQPRDTVDRCETTDCFNQQQIRDFEVLDSTTLVVFVGNQSCPFRVEFTGAYCDLTFLPGTELVFRNDFLRSQREPANMLMRICSHDSNIGVDEGPFTTAPGGEEFPDGRNPCRIESIASMTDDELLELYVEKQVVAPPPPFGTGEIAVPEDAEAPPATPQGESAAEGGAGQTPDSPTDADAP